MSATLGGIPLPDDAALALAFSQVAGLTRQLEEAQATITALNVRAQRRITELDRLMRVRQSELMTYNAILNETIKNLHEKYFELNPDGDIPNAKGVGPVIAQACESLFAEINSLQARITELGSGGREEWRIVASVCSGVEEIQETTKHIAMAIAEGVTDNRVRIESRRVIETEWKEVK